LATTTGDVLFGLRPMEKFLTDLKNELKVDDEKIVSIASEINQEIFFPIKESLRNIYASTQKEIEPLLKKAGAEKAKESEKESEVVEKIKETVTKGVVSKTMPRVSPPPIRPAPSKISQSQVTNIPPQTTKSSSPKSEEKYPQMMQQPTPKTTELKKDILEELTK